MKVIGAGLPRTGTMSTQAALKQLGFSCYHMQEVPREPGHLVAWLDLVHERAPMDWQALFRDYEATVDTPACFYFEELMAAFPEAKVLLTVRDPERWYESVSTLLDSVRPLRPLRRVVPRLRKFLDLVDSLAEKFLTTATDRESMIAAAQRHNEAVKRIVPPDRLLVFQVQDGWEPLCAFLGCEVPDAPFPHLNEAATVGERLRGMFLPGPRRMLLGAVAMVLAVLAACWRLA